MVHLIKKLTFTGVLHATGRCATGKDMGIASAILSDQSQSKMVVFFGEMIQNVSRTGIHVDRTEKRKL